MKLRKGFPFFVFATLGILAMLASVPLTASAQDTVYVYGQTSFGNGSTCTAGLGTKVSAVVTSDGSNYKLVYTYDVKAGSGTASVTDCIPVRFVESNTNNTNGQGYTYHATGVTGASWSAGSFTVADNGTTSYTDNIKLDTGALSPGHYTYTPTVAYYSCTGPSCSKPNFLVGASETFSGKVEIDVWVDGLDTLDITAETSAGSHAPAVTELTDTYQWQYAYTIPNNTGVSDNFNVSLCVDDTDSAGDDPALTPKDAYTVGVTYDSTDSSLNTLTPTIGDNVNLDDGDCASPKTVNVSFDTSNLTTGVHTIVFQVGLVSGDESSINQSDINVSPATPACYTSGDCPADVETILVVINVEGASSNCFLSDGEFNLLSQCGGLKPGEQGYVGPQTFQIVAGGKGRKTIVATNPGQFFLSTIYTNNDSTEVTVFFKVSGISNLVSQGANPVHAAIFGVGYNSPSELQHEDGFDAVLGSGTPCSDPVTHGCTFAVPDNTSIWIVWHAKYSQIGSAVGSDLKGDTTCQTGVNDDQGTIKATLTLKENDNFGDVLATCDLSAQGNLKH